MTVRDVLFGIVFFGLVGLAYWAEGYFTKRSAARSAVAPDLRRADEAQRQPDMDPNAPRDRAFQVMDRFGPSGSGGAGL